MNVDCCNPLIWPQSSGETTLEEPSLAVRSLGVQIESLLSSRESASKQVPRNEPSGSNGRREKEEEGLKTLIG